MEHVRLNIDHDEIRKLSRLQPWKAVWTLACDWAVIVGAIAIGTTFPNPLVYVICVVAIAGRMHGLAALMHETSHYRVLKSKRLSDWIGDLFMAWPIMLNVPSYRRNHSGHHIHLNTDKDPDWITKVGKKQFTFPAEVGEILPHILGYFTLVSTTKDFVNFTSRVNGSTESTGYRVIKAGYYAVVAAAVTWFGVWKEFLLFWALPYFTVLFLLAYLRAVADHFGAMEYSGVLTGTRTTVKPGFLIRALIQPHNLNYHIEHHLYPSVPFYNLPKLHKLLMQDETFRSRAHITVGLMGVVRECLKHPAPSTEQAKAA